MLSLNNVKSRYGRIEALHGVSLDVAEGEVVGGVRPPRIELVGSGEEGRVAVRCGEQDERQRVRPTLAKR